MSASTSSGRSASPSAASSRPGAACVALLRSRRGRGFSVSTRATARAARASRCCSASTRGRDARPGAPAPARRPRRRGHALYALRLLGAPAAPLPGSASALPGLGPRVAFRRQARENLSKVGASEERPSPNKRIEQTRSNAGVDTPARERSQLMRETLCRTKRVAVDCTEPILNATATPHPQARGLGSVALVFSIELAFCVYLPSSSSRCSSLRSAVLTLPSDRWLTLAAYRSPWASSRPLSAVRVGAWSPSFPARRRRRAPRWRRVVAVILAAFSDALRLE